MSSQAIEEERIPVPVVEEMTPVQANPQEPATEVAEDVEVPTGGPLIKAELYGTAKEKRLAAFVTNAESTRQTAGAEGFKRSQNMKIESVVTNLLTDGQQVCYSNKANPLV
jgi:hypothetical protein